MFRFTIREMALVTLVVAMGVGWWVDHRTQTAAVDYYSGAYEQWRDRVESIDEMLKALGFEIKEEGFTKTYTPPSDMSNHASSLLVSPGALPGDHQPGLDASMFHLAIRELAMVTLVVALGVGWWLDRNQLSARLRFVERGSRLLVPQWEDEHGGPLKILVDDQSFPPSAPQSFAVWASPPFVAAFLTATQKRSA